VEGMVAVGENRLKSCGDRSNLPKFAGNRGECAKINDFHHRKVEKLWRGFQLRTSLRFFNEKKN